MAKKTQRTDGTLVPDQITRKEWAIFDRHMNGVLSEVQRNDGFVNTVTGLGAAGTKGKGAQFVPGSIYPPEFWEAMYTSDTIPARIVDLIVDDAIREGFDVTIESDADRDLASDILDRFEDLGLHEKIPQAAKWGRLYGWGGLLLITDDIVGNIFNTTQTINPYGTLIKPGKRSASAAKPPGGVFSASGLTPNPSGDETPGGRTLGTELPEAAKLLNVIELERRDVEVAYWDLEPTSPNYGNPAMYRVRSRVPGSAGAFTLVHSSRILSFGGMKAPRMTRTLNLGFDLSVLQQPYDVISQHGMSWEAIAALLQDAAQSVFKVSNLLGTVAAGQGDALRGRFQVLDNMRSVNRAIVIDKDKEDFERKDYAFSGYDKLIDKIETRLAMAAGMPVTVLMGISPAGLNATGESDMALWENKVKAYQKKDIKPIWCALIDRIASTEFGLDEETFEVTPKPLRQTTRMEEADIRLKVAQTDQIYAGIQALTPEEIAINRFGPKGWSPETQIDPEVRAQIAELDAQTALEKAKDPGPTPGEQMRGEATPPDAAGAPPKAKGGADEGASD